VNLQRPMADLLIELSVQAWLHASRIASYAMLNWLEDPAMLAMAFC
jgi:hypothetical protein